MEILVYITVCGDVVCASSSEQLQDLSHDHSLSVSAVQLKTRLITIHKLLQSCAVLQK